MLTLFKSKTGTAPASASSPSIDRDQRQTPFFHPRSAGKPGGLPMCNCLPADFGGTLLPPARSALMPDRCRHRTPYPRKTQPKPKRILLVNEQRSFQMMMKAMLINIGIQPHHLHQLPPTRAPPPLPEEASTSICSTMGWGRARTAASAGKPAGSTAHSAPKRGDHGQQRRLPRHGAERAGSRADRYLMKPFSRSSSRFASNAPLARRRALESVFSALTGQSARPGGGLCQ